MTATTKQKITLYKDLVVWQRSMDLVDVIYQWTSMFPDEERFGLVTQMRRAAVSIPSNIAEGRRRHTAKDFASFLDISFGSVAELETQCEIAFRRTYGDAVQYEQSMKLLEEISKMLFVMIYKLRPSGYLPRQQSTNPRASNLSS